MLKPAPCLLLISFALNSQAQNKPDDKWLTVARQELAAARDAAAKRLPEPLPKPGQWTRGEYEMARMAMERLLKENQGGLRLDPHQLSARTQASLSALIPETMKRWKRESLLRLANQVKGNRMAIENVAASQPHASALLDERFMAELRKRLPEADRKVMFRRFAEKTGLKDSWSLTHPYDDLDGREMGQVSVILMQIDKEGVGSLNQEQRALLLRTGASDWYERKLAATEK